MTGAPITTSIARQPAPAGIPDMRPVLGIARGGWPMIGAFVLFAAGVWASGLAWLGMWGAVPGLLATAVAAWSAWFFRDPERTPPVDAGVLVSAADGVVCGVGPAAIPAEVGLPGGGTRISVFMNIFNVHVNRAPEAGRILRVAYTPGKFFNASLDKASEHNERCALLMELPGGRAMTVVQIAGLVARRIVRGVGEGTALVRGERLGLIRFGSRVDVYLPEGYEATVRVGDPVKAGESVIARAAGGSVPA